MLLSLQSTRPQYNHIQTNIQIPWNCEYIKYYVESINTKSLLIANEEDYVEVYYEYDKVDEDDSEKVEHIFKCYTWRFEKHYTMDDDHMKRNLQHEDRYVGQIMDVEFDRADRIVITPHVPMCFTFSHRAGLVTGLYNIKMNTEYAVDEKIKGEIPIWDYANKLYLISKQGQSIQSNIGDREYNPSIIANIDHVIGPGIPIIANFEFLSKPIKNIVNIDSFKQIELELVDFQYQPIPLESPMFVTIKVKPCMNPQMRLKE